VEQAGTEAHGKEIPRPPYAAGAQCSRPAPVVRGSSRRITTMTASNRSTREYQSDQPSYEAASALAWSTSDVNGEGALPP